MIFKEKNFNLGTWYHKPSLQLKKTFPENHITMKVICTNHVVSSFQYVLKYDELLQIAHRGYPILAHSRQTPFKFKEFVDETEQHLAFSFCLKVVHCTSVPSLSQTRLHKTLTLKQQEFSFDFSCIFNFEI